MKIDQEHIQNYTPVNLFPNNQIMKLLQLHETHITYDERAMQTTHNSNIQTYAHIEVVVTFLVVNIFIEMVITRHHSVGFRPN